MNAWQRQTPAQKTFCIVFSIIMLCFCAWLVHAGIENFQRDSAKIERDNQEVSQLINQLGGQDRQARADAAERLGGFKNRRATKPLIAALDDKDLDVRRAAVFALGQINDPSAFDPLIVGLKDNDIYIRLSAAQAMGKIKDPRAVNALLAAWKQHDMAVIAGADSFFIERGEPNSEDILIEALNDKALYNIEGLSLRMEIDDKSVPKIMAEDFLNCGNPKLVEAAREWATRNDYQIVNKSADGAVHWGSRQ
jgi:HEAT repeat protein